MIFDFVDFDGVDDIMNNMLERFEFGVRDSVLECSYPGVRDGLCEEVMCAAVVWSYGDMLDINNNNKILFFHIAQSTNFFISN